MTTTKDKLEFVYQLARYTSMPLSAMQRLMRLGATHTRIETELANAAYRKHVNDCATRLGHRCDCSMFENHDATQKAKAKRDRIDARMEGIAREYGFRIEYGALTVRVVIDTITGKGPLVKREVYIP